MGAYAATIQVKWINNTDTELTVKWAGNNAGATLKPANAAGNATGVVSAGLTADAILYYSIHHHDGSSSTEQPALRFNGDVQQAESVDFRASESVDWQAALYHGMAMDESGEGPRYNLHLDRHGDGLVIVGTVEIGTGGGH